MKRESLQSKSMKKEMFHFLHFIINVNNERGGSHAHNFPNTLCLFVRLFALLLQLFHNSVSKFHTLKMLNTKADDFGACLHEFALGKVKQDTKAFQMLK